MREDVQAAYDAMAEAYATETAEETSATSLLGTIEAEVDPSGRILDVGCGDGTAVAGRLEDRFEVVALDLSREQLRLAADNLGTAALVQGEMTQLPFESGTVDAILAYYAIIHVPRTEHQAVFEEWARVLEPGGWALFSSGTERWEGRNPDWLETGIEMAWSYLDPAATIDALEAAGFDLQETTQVTDSLADDGQKQFFLARLPADPQSINASARKEG